MMILFLIVLIIAAFLEVNNRKLPYYVFYSLVTILAFLEGIRWYSGVDFPMYYNSYSQVLNPLTELHNKRYDRFYLWLTMLFKFLKVDFTLFLLFLSSVTASLYSWSLKKYTAFPILGLLVLFVSLIGFLGNNRQLIAMAIIFFGIQFIINKKYFHYVLAVLLAVGFHFTAIIMLPVVFFRNEISFKKWVAVIGIIILIGLFPFDNLILWIVNNYQKQLPFLAERFNAYEQLDDENIKFSQIILGIIRKLSPIIFVFLFRDKLKNNTGYYLFLNISFLSLALYIWTSLNFTFFLGRLTIYYSVFECVIYSWIGYVFVKQKQNQMIVLLFFAFCVFLFFKGISLYPELFIPFKTRFFTL